jgi:hypothetical protein
MGTSTDRKEYLAEYYRKRRAKIRAQRKEKYLENREAEIARSAKKDKRNPNRKTSSQVGPPLRRRWVVIGEEIFFNSKLGFGSAEMVTALRDLHLSLDIRDQWNVPELNKRRRDHLRNFDEKRRAARKAAMAAARKGTKAKPVTKGAKAGEGLTLGTIRRKWMVIGTRLYFNPTQPLQVQELLRAMGQLQAEVRKRSDSSPAPQARASAPRTRAREKSTA